MIGQDNRYLIIGAYGGIGQALVKRLKTKQATLHLMGRNEDKLKALASETQSEYTCVDATNITDMDNAFASAQTQLGQIDGVALCVGSILLKPAHLTTVQEWQEILATNLTAAFATVHAAANVMMPSGGSVVLISSAAGSIGLPNHEAIAAAKAGIDGLMRSAAATYAHNNLRFNCIAPGLVQTPLAEPIMNSPTAKKISQAMHPLGRVGVPAHIASLIEWLLDPDNDWVTGQIYGVDGGLATLKQQVNA